jgi:hypothetical protein
VHGPVDSAAIVRGYEYGPGQHVVVEPDELDQLRPAQDSARANTSDKQPMMQITRAMLIAKATAARRAERRTERRCQTARAPKATAATTANHSGTVSNKLM